MLLQLPLTLNVMSPAHIPNWDLVSDIVSTTSRIYRSPKQCRLRYENVIIPREEGKLTYDANPRKQSKKMPKSVMYKVLALNIMGPIKNSYTLLVYRANLVHYLNVAFL